MTTSVAELCKRLLEPECNVVDIVTNGRAMIRAAVELKPDIIFGAKSSAELVRYAVPNHIIAA